MYEVTEFRDCLERTVAALRRHGIRFCLTGGAAFIAYGDPRMTQDIDLVVDGERLEESLQTLLPELKQQQFLLNEDAIRTAIRSRRQFQLIDLVSALKLDFYPRELVAGNFDRAAEIEIMPGLRLPVSSIPDLVASKLVWISKGSHKSRRDVKMLMRQSSAAEAALAREFAERLQLEALLDEVLAEPDEIDF